VTGPVGCGPCLTGPVTLCQTAPQGVNHFHIPPSTGTSACVSMPEDIPKIRHNERWKVQWRLTKNDKGWKVCS